MTRAPFSQLAHQLSKVLSLPADPVTGLLTRSGIEKLVDWRLGSRSARAPSSVLYGDIDQLHVVNDMLGFEAGDQAIAAVAQRTAGATRQRRRSAEPLVRRSLHDLLAGFPARSRARDRRRAARRRQRRAAGDRRRHDSVVDFLRRRHGARRRAQLRPCTGRRRSRLQGGQGSRPQSRRVLRSARLEHESPHRRHRHRRPAAQRAGERQLPDLRPADRAAAAARASAPLRNAAAAHR